MAAKANKRIYTDDMPKSLAKTFKAMEKAEKKKTEEEKASDRRHANSGLPDTLELYFVEKEKYGITGVYEDALFPLSDKLPLGKPSAGETWRCMIEHGQNILYDTCIPIQFISKAEIKEEAVSAEAEDLENEIIGDAVSTEVVSSDELAHLREELEKYKKMVSDMKDENGRYKEKCREVERLNREVESLRDGNDTLRKEVKDKEGNNFQLRNQISALERKSKNQNINILEDKVRNLESENNSLRFQNERLTAIIENNDIDVDNVQGRNVFSVMTGAQMMHSAVFADGRYTVQFGRNFTTLRLIPDENGAVECKDGNIVLPALGVFSKFEHLNKLPTVVEDGIITVGA